VTGKRAYPFLATEKGIRTLFSYREMPLFFKKVLKQLLPHAFCERYYPQWLKFLCFTRWVIRPRLPKLENDAVNLHLGCGFVNHPKFINIDAMRAPHIHYVRRIEDLSLFKDNSVDLIYASHCLEHFSHLRIPRVLAEWYRTIKPHGILRLSVPDFDLLINIYQENHHDINTILQPLMGVQLGEYRFHKTVFTKNSLTSLLHAAGFIEVREWVPGSSELTSFNDWSGRKLSVNGKEYPVSLNVESVK
jgi:predicted SAM-dependent methyltransferase